MFWEQFDMCIQSKTQLTNMKKLASLRHALKDRPASQALEGLSQSADQYEEAIGCLKDAMTDFALYHRSGNFRVMKNSHVNFSRWESFAVR